MGFAGRHFELGDKDRLGAEQMLGHPIAPHAHIGAWGHRDNVLARGREHDHGTAGREFEFVQRWLLGLARVLPASLPRTRLPEGFATRLAERERAREAAGGPAAGAASYNILDLELDLQTMREMNLMLGAGLVVYGDRANMLDQALNASTFFRNESCGKCVPCRLGSQKLVELASGLLQLQYDEESIRPIEKLHDRPAADDGDDLDLRPRAWWRETP